MEAKAETNCSGLVQKQSWSVSIQQGNPSDWRDYWRDPATVVVFGSAVVWSTPYENTFPKIRVLILRNRNKK